MAFMKELFLEEARPPTASRPAKKGNTSQVGDCASKLASQSSYCGKGSLENHLQQAKKLQHIHDDGIFFGCSRKPRRITENKVS